MPRPRAPNSFNTQDVPFTGDQSHSSSRGVPLVTSSTTPIRSSRTRPTTSVQRLIKDLKEDNLELRIKLAMVQEEVQRIRTTAHLEVSSLHYKLDVAEQQKKVAGDSAAAIQRSLIRELKTLIRSNVRLDAQDVVQNHLKITVKEVDTQLEWHRLHRGIDVPETGTTRGVKVSRWAKVVQDYRTEIEEMIDNVSLLGGLSTSDGDSAMDVDEDSVV